MQDEPRWPCTGRRRTETIGAHGRVRLCRPDVVGNGLLDGLMLPILENLPDAPFVGAAFEQLRQEFATPAFATHVLAGALMKACLALVIRKHVDHLLAAGGFPSKPGHRQLRLALTHVLYRPDLPHSVASLRWALDSFAVAKA